MVSSSDCDSSSWDIFRLFSFSSGSKKLFFNTLLVYLTFTLSPFINFWSFDSVRSSSVSRLFSWFSPPSAKSSTNRLLTTLTVFAFPILGKLVSTPLIFTVGVFLSFGSAQKTCELRFETFSLLIIARFDINMLSFIISMCSSSWSSRKGDVTIF